MKIVAADKPYKTLGDMKPGDLYKLEYSNAVLYMDIDIDGNIGTNMIKKGKYAVDLTRNRAIWMGVGYTVKVCPVDATLTVE